MTINFKTIVLPNNDKTFILGQTPMSDQRVYSDKKLKHQMKLRFTREDVSRVDNVLWWVYASVYYKAQQISVFDHFY